MMTNKKNDLSKKYRPEDEDGDDHSVMRSAFLVINSVPDDSTKRIEILRCTNYLVKK